MSQPFDFKRFVSEVQEVAEYDCDMGLYHPLQQEDALFELCIEGERSDCVAARRVLYLQALIIYRRYVAQTKPELLQPIGPSEGIDFAEYGKAVAELDLAMNWNSSNPDVVCGSTFSNWPEDAYLRSCYLTFARSYSSHFREHATQGRVPIVQAMKPKIKKVSDYVNS